eukprot:6172327-Pleurochrysis_carterae.AAC.2
MATQLRCASEDEVGLPEPCAYAPCSKSRASSALVPFILIFVIALNYIPFVVWSLEWGRSGHALQRRRLRLFSERDSAPRSVHARMHWRSGECASARAVELQLCFASAFS